MVPWWGVILFSWGTFMMGWVCCCWFINGTKKEYYETEEKLDG
jgi:hypothetical protein